MATILEIEAPGISGMLRGLTAEERRAAISAACLAVAASLEGLQISTRYLLDILAEGQDLSAQDLLVAQELVEEADSQYLSLEALGDHEAALVRFSEARLLTALAQGLGNASTSESEEAVYELSKACDDPSPVFEIIRGFAK